MLNDKMIFEEESQNSNVPLNYITTKRTQVSESGNNLANTSNASDLHLIQEVRSLFTKLISVSKQVVKNNAYIANIHTELNTLLDNAQKSYSIFYHEAEIYFNKHHYYRVDTPRPQIICSSSASVPFEEFMKNWILLGKCIDDYASSHPPPHLKQINLKFKSIVSSIEIIKNFNEKRKFPSNSLRKSVDAIESINEKLSESIYELFMQPSFPNFETDLEKSFIDDIESYKQVLSDAFLNEFVQSGVLPTDLTRIKANVMSDCREIIDCIKLSFRFPSTMVDISNMKKSLDEKFEIIKQKLSTPFTVIAPAKTIDGPDHKENICENGENGTNSELSEKSNANFGSTSSPPPKGQTTPIKGNISSTPENNIIMRYISDLFPFFKVEGELSPDEFKNIIIERMTQYDIEKRNHEIQIKLLNDRIKAEKENTIDNENICSSKLVLMNQKIKDLEFENEALKAASTKSKGKLKSSENELLKAHSLIEHYASRGDPSTLRNGLLDTLRYIVKSLEISDFEFNDSDEALVKSLKKFTTQILNTTCKECDVKTSYINTICDKIKELSCSHDDDTQSNLNTIKERIADLEKKYKSSLEEKDAIVKQLYRIGIEVLRTSRLSAEKIETYTTAQISDSVLEKVTKLKRNSVSAAEMERRMLNDFNNEINKIHEDFIELLPDSHSLKSSDVTRTDESLIGLESSMIKGKIEALNTIKEVLTEEKRKTCEKINELTNINERLKYDIQNVGREICETLGVQENFKGCEDVIAKTYIILEDMKRPFQEKIDEQMEHIGDLNNKISSIYARFRKVDTENKIEDVDKQFSKIHDLIGVVLDQNEEFEKDIVENKSKYEEIKSYLAKIYVSLKSATAEDVSAIEKLNDEEIYKEVLNLIDNILSSKFDSSYIQADKLANIISDTIKLLTKCPSDDQVENIQYLCRKFNNMDESLNVLYPMNQYLDNIFSMLPKQSYKAKNDSLGLTLLKKQISKLKTYLVQVSERCELSKIVSIISKLIKLIELLVYN